MAVRYERIDVQLTTRAVAQLAEVLQSRFSELDTEAQNFANELSARIQHRDADPHAPLNQEQTCDTSWLD